MSSTVCMLSAALRHHQAGAFSEAEQLYREILLMDPQHADALHLLGVMANQLRKPKLAVELIGRAIEINPLASTYHNNLANALKACGDRVRAEAGYRQAVVLDRKNAEAHANLGQFLEEQGRPEEAQLSYQAALRCSPTMTVAQVSLARVTLAMGDVKLAVK